MWTNSGVHIPAKGPTSGSGERCRRARADRPDQLDPYLRKLQMMPSPRRRGHHRVYDRPPGCPTRYGTRPTGARDLVHDCCEPHVAAHSERSFQFAGLVARAEGVELDVEVLYIGTLLHDVGLAARFAGPDRFEMRGANAARSMLLEADMDTARAENVWDVIALHASTAIATHKSPETRIANRGISIDVRGAGAERLPPAAVRKVLDTWPRHLFPSTFEATLIDEVRANPSSVRSSWMECIAVAHVPGFQPTDFLSTLHSSAGFA